MHLQLDRSAAISLALAAMLLRALLPDGWMPGGEATPFTICSVEAAHHEGKAPGQPSRERSHAPCAFSAAAPLAPPAVARLAWGTKADALHIAVLFTDKSVASAFLHRPNAARAPPAIA